MSGDYPGETLTLRGVVMVGESSDQIAAAVLPALYAEFVRLQEEGVCRAEITEEDGTQRIVGECGVRDIVGEGEITNVAVHPDWQGFGIASRMLGDVLARSLEEGMTAFTLEVRAGNRPAIALYKKYGFHTEGIRADFYDKPVEDALIMWRRIN